MASIEPRSPQSSSSLLNNLAAAVQRQSERGWRFENVRVESQDAGGRFSVSQAGRPARTAVGVVASVQVQTGAHVIMLGRGTRDLPMILGESRYITG